MNDYVGKICPFCKTPFVEEDEVVVCDTCHMPHHKDCWIENQGCTTFGCTGTVSGLTPIPESVIGVNDIDFAAAENNVETDFSSALPITSKVCQVCGSENPADAAFCSKCGYLLGGNTAPNTANTVYAGPSNSSNPYPYTVASQNSTNPYAYATSQQNLGYGNTYTAPYQNAEYSSGYNTGFDVNPLKERIIGKNATYYTGKFNKLKSGNTKASWNWPAFLITPYWMFYRKNYAVGASILGFYLFLMFSTGAFLKWISICSLAISILGGIFGNYIYMMRVEKLEQEVAKLQSQALQEDFLKKNAGASAGAAVISAVVYLTILTISIW